MMQRLIHTQSTRPKVLLLDVDGVIIQQPKVIQHVSRNIVQYFSKELDLPMHNALQVNKLLYSEYGHSYRGLRKVFNFDKSIHHFNTSVYTPDVLQLVKESNQDMLQHVNYMQLKQMVLRCRCENVPVYLFTNAPFVWCKTVLSASGLDKFIPDEHIISCDHDVMLYHEDDGFKPAGVVYETVQHYINNVHRLEDSLFVFIEDSFKNLVPIVGESSWLPVYLNHTTLLNAPDSVAVIHSTKEGKMLMDKVLHPSNTSQ